MELKMLTREQIETIAMEYLLKNNYPIITPGIVTMPDDKEDEDDKDDEEFKEFMEKNNIAMVSFSTNYPDDPLDPFRELTPMRFLLYVNFITGEVKMLNPAR
jgi:hypothetical protein